MSDRPSPKKPDLSAENPRITVTRKRIADNVFLVETIIEKPVYKDNIIEKVIEVPVPKIIEVFKDNPIRVPVYREFLVKKKVPKEIIKEIIVEKIVENIVEVPVIREVIIEKYIDVPKEVVKRVIRHVPKYVDNIIEKPKFVERVHRVPVANIIEKTVEVEKIIMVPVHTHRQEQIDDTKKNVVQHENITGVNAPMRKFVDPVNKKEIIIEKFVEN